MSKSVHIVDTLVAGDVLRIAVDGLPVLDATEPEAVLRELREKHEELRRFLIEPPRGHAAINAALLFPSSTSQADRCFVVAAQIGFAPYAGTPMMAAAAALFAAGLIEETTAVTSVTFETAKGVFSIDTKPLESNLFSARWHATRPTIINHDQAFTLRDKQAFKATVLSCGLPYVVVRARDFEASFADPQSLSATGIAVADAVAKQLPLEEIGLERDLSHYSVVILGKGEGDSTAGRFSQEVAWVSHDGWVSATPAGTGTLAAAATLFTEGSFEAGDTFRATSPSGHSLDCRMTVEDATVEGQVEIIADSRLIGS